MLTAYPRADPLSSSELRRRSLALIFRSLFDEVVAQVTDASQGDPPFDWDGTVPQPTKSNCIPSLSLPTSVLLGHCQKLVSAREACLSSSSSIVDVLNCISDLELLYVAPTQLRDSNLGRELNHRFWREHANQEISKRSRVLVRNWRARVAGQGCGPQEHGSPHDLVAANSLDQAWSEALAARCAQTLEAAVWTKFAGSMGLHGGAKDALEWSRAYKGKVRFLATMLKRPENVALRREALDGKVTGEFLVDRTEEEFLPAERLAEIQRHRKEGLQSVILQKLVLDLYDADLACPFCGQLGAKYGVVCDTGSVPIDGSAGHKRQKTKKQITAECSACSERWNHNDGWHV